VADNFHVVGSVVVVKKRKSQRGRKFALKLGYPGQAVSALQGSNAPGGPRVVKKMLDSGASARRPEIALKPLMNVTPKSRWQRSAANRNTVDGVQCD
jgi:hypothetical protein